MEIEARRRLFEQQRRIPHVSERSRILAEKRRQKIESGEFKSVRKEQNEEPPKP